MKRELCEDAIISSSNGNPCTRNAPKWSQANNLVTKLQEKIEEFMTNMAHDMLEIWWTPGHEGIKENEREMKRQKSGKGDTSQMTNCPPDAERDKDKLSMARQNHTKLTNLNCQTIHKIVQILLHEIDPSTPSPRFWKDSEWPTCEQAAMLIQLRMGHILLRLTCTE